jgi:hypothetical protein
MGQVTVQKVGISVHQVGIYSTLTLPQSEGIRQPHREINTLANFIARHAENDGE